MPSVVFAGAIHDCAVLLQPVNYSVSATFLPDREYRQYRSCFQVSAVGIEALET